MPPQTDVLAFLSLRALESVGLDWASKTMRSCLARRGTPDSPPRNGEWPRPTAEIGSPVSFPLARFERDSGRICGLRSRLKPIISLIGSTFDIGTIAGAQLMHGPDASSLSMAACPEMEKWWISQGARHGMNFFDSSAVSGVCKLKAFLSGSGF